MKYLIIESPFKIQSPDCWDNSVRLLANRSQGSNTENDSKRFKSGYIWVAASQCIDTAQHGSNPDPNFVLENCSHTPLWSKQAL